jgi:hypothetical protein
VISDPQHPENNGKVFLFSFGKTILDKINALLNPEFEDEKPVAAFDYWEGADFRLRIKKKDGYTNYEDSTFDAPSQLADDKDLEKIHEKTYDLGEFLDPSRFKTYEQLKAQYIKIVGKKDVSVVGLGWDTTDTGEDESPAPSRSSKSTRTVVEDDEPKPAKKNVEKVTTQVSSSSDDDDDDYYEKLLASI